MPEEILRNPAVNPVVDTDGSSNAERRRYNSTTDDLLDRIRQAVEAINGGGGGGSNPYSSYLIGWSWVTFQVESSFISFYKFCKQTEDGLFYYDFQLSEWQSFPSENPIHSLSNLPIKKVYTGRVEGSLTDEYTYNMFSDDLHLPSCKKLIINKLFTNDDIIATLNLFNIEIVVLPESLLGDIIEENYYTVEINGVESKYYLESFNGLPIINKILLTEFDLINQIKISASTGVILEYKITSTYPSLN